MAEISDLITELKQEHKEDKDQADALLSLETAFPTQLGQSLIASGVISEASSGLHTSLLEEIRAGIGGMKESLSTRLGNFVKGFNVFQLGFGASDRGRRKSAAESAHRESLMQSDIQDLSEYFNKGQGLARALTEHQNKGVLGKMFGKGLKQQEKEDEAGAMRQKHTGLLMSIAENTGGIHEEFMKGDDKEKKPFDFMKLLKKMVLGAAIAGIIAFLNSDYWKNMKINFDGMKESLVSLYENYLVPIWDIFKNSIVKSWDNIKVLFTGLKESFALFGEGKWWEGIKTFFGSIGTFLANMLDNALTGIWNVIATIFGLSPTDSVFGSISGFFTDIYDEVVSWIKITWFNISTTISKVWADIKNFFVDTFNFISEGIAGAWTTATDFIKGIWDSVVKWFKGLWTWASEGIAKGWTTVTTFITGIWDSVVKWFKGLWTWAEAGIAKTWTGVTNFIKGVWDSVVLWFEGLWTWTEGTIAGTWTGVTNFIKGVWDSVVKWFEGLWTWVSGTIAGTWTGVSGFIKGVWDSVVLWFEGLWTWVSGTIAGTWTGVTNFIKGVWDSVVLWFEGLWTWTEGTIAGTWTGVSGFIKGVWDSVVKWFEGLWSWGDDIGAKIAGTFKGVGTLIGDVFKSAKDWFVKLFSWKKAEPKEGEKEFSISKMISDLWRDITQALKDIFPSFDDLKNMLPSPGELLDKMTPSWLGGGGNTLATDMSAQDKEAEIKDIKEKMAATEVRILQHNAELGKEGFAKHGPTQRKRYLDKLAVDQAKLGEQEAKLYELQKKRMGGPVKKGMPYLVGEGTVKPELFVPSSSGMIISADRVAQMQESGLRRGAGGAGSSPTIVNAPTTSINNSSSNMTNTTTSFSHPSAILNTVNAAA
jgi:hypothetical protein